VEVAKQVSEVEATCAQTVAEVRKPQYFHFLYLVDIL
jgi:hypothetical protein